jgi:outer membrane protein assembly factor BamA
MSFLGIFFPEVSTAAGIADSLELSKNIIIRKIILAGNEVTDEDVILREIRTKENHPLNADLLKKDLERLYNLSLFNKIDIFPVPTDSLNTIDLMFLFEESLYIIPLPQGGFRNGQLTQFWAGLNLIWRNFRGRNETLNASFGIGADPFVGVGYTIPWIGRDAHYFASVNVSFSKTRNQSLQTVNSSGNEIPDSDINYSLYNFKSSLTVGKYFTPAFSVTGSLRYTSLVTTQYEPGRTVSSDGKDQFFDLSINGRYDTRNSYDYTTDGTLLIIDYTKEGFGGLIDFNRVSIDARNFIPVKLSDSYSVSLGISATGSVSFGTPVPSYMKQFFGYDKVIRGHKKLVYEGDNRLGFFNEIRFPILKERYLKGSDIPAVNQFSMFRRMNYRFAIYATVFFDIGTTWNMKDRFFHSQYHNGFGAGLNFILPFGLIGRTDYAFRIDGKQFVPQIVFDLNAAF